MSTVSTWRKYVYKELSDMSFDGKVLDIGGSSKLGYLQLLKGKHEVDINNIDEEYGCTMNFDLEKPWPVVNGGYDGILAINILEHIFDYGHVLSESYRALKPKGKIVIAVPFLISIHPCPHDYWRFTEETLKKILEKAGFSDVCIISIGTGVFSAEINLKHNFLRRIPVLWRIRERMAFVLDALLKKTGKGKSFSEKQYPLGYVVTAKKI